MSSFRIPLVWQMYGHVNVEADTLDDAIKYALGPDCPLPEGEYVDDSIQVDDLVLNQEATHESHHNQARSAFYPSIVLSGSAGWTNSAGSMIVNPGKFLASAVGSLTQPLFNRGQVIAQYRISKAQQEEARLFFEQALLNAGSEVNDALTACQTSREKTVLFDKQIVSLQKALKSTSLLMEHGTTNYLEVLTARQTLLSAQLSQTANRFTEIQSVISLYQALGGGRE